MYALNTCLVFVCCRAQKKARSIIERAFGQLKRRFACLHGELRYFRSYWYKYINTYITTKTSLLYIIVIITMYN